MGSRPAKKSKPIRNRAPGPVPRIAGGQNDNPQFCRHFVKQKCGGCSFLHIPYAEQVEAKQQKVIAILTAALRDLPEAVRNKTLSVVRPTVPSPLPMGHRASAKFCMHEDRFGNKVIGLYRQGSRVVVDTAGCPANVALANEILQKMFVRKNIIPAKFYDHQGRVFQKNRMKFLTIRTSPSGKGTVRDAAVVISHTGVDRGAIAQWLKSAGLQDLCVYESRLTKADGDSFTGRFIDHACGPETFPYALNGEVFDISPASFFQANHALAEKLIAAATSFKSDGDVLVDLYAGFGAYSFALKSPFKEIHIVDGNRAAIAAANAHAKKIGATHIKAVADMCENFLDKRVEPETAKRVTHIIVNPSRAGMSPQVLRHFTSETFPMLKALHYVSCSPVTFARDTKALLRQGFQMTSLTPFDMFPNADHVEVVGTFVR
jgi:23S rRNA (uracil1939-C5)-methyltransferase